VSLLATSSAFEPLPNKQGGEPLRSTVKGKDTQAKYCIIQKKQYMQYQTEKCYKKRKAASQAKRNT
jgi:hypothetical protein